MPCGLVICFALEIDMTPDDESKRTNTLNSRRATREKPAEKHSEPLTFGRAFVQVEFWFLLVVAILAVLFKLSTPSR